MIEITWFLEYDAHGQKTINLKYNMIDQNRQWFDDLDKYISTKFMKINHIGTSAWHDSVLYVKNEHTGVHNSLPLTHGLTFQVVENFISGNKMNNTAVDFLRELNLFVRMYCERNKIIL
jgi:hypothetical protein